ncbi:hypothetical protein BESB_035880 [Besnoitia besnoiti]|uniref:Yip1 domain-containing protein n=1 Tax=Besnoitia besnoiti TaxID=94643 RepID=A0A2A9MN90_BESBE|nr:hypothetical protein BESB_035880 [Besnoitia besnoiti]PFH37130.1 hypothetical protein BESB_035880 [Besnoitia besnoiti]
MASSSWNAGQGAYLSSRRLSGSSACEAPQAPHAPADPQVDSKARLHQSAAFLTSQQPNGVAQSGGRRAFASSAYSAHAAPQQAHSAAGGGGAAAQALSAAFPTQPPPRETAASGSGETQEDWRQPPAHHLQAQTPAGQRASSYASRPAASYYSSFSAAAYPAATGYGTAGEEASREGGEPPKAKSLKEHQEFLLKQQLEADRAEPQPDRRGGGGAAEGAALAANVWTDKKTDGVGLSFYSAPGQTYPGRAPAGAPQGFSSEPFASALAPHAAAHAVAGTAGSRPTPFYPQQPYPAFGVPSGGAAAAPSFSSLGLSGSMRAAGEEDAAGGAPKGFFSRLFSFGAGAARDEARSGAADAQSAKGRGDEDDAIEDEPPLLEELGIHPEEVLQRVKSVLFFYKLEHDLLVHSDMCGPLVVAITLAFLLLMLGKASFGHIYGLSIVGSLCTYVLLNLMSPREGIDLYSTISILGYGLLPVLLIALASLFVALKSSFFGLLFSLFCVLWCTATASRFFEAALQMHDQRYLVAYPISLFYASFVVIAVL